MPRITVKRKGSLDGAFINSMQGRMKELQLQTLKNITLMTPVHTGELRRSFIPETVIEDDGVYRADITNKLPYAQAIDQGADPHPVSREGVFAISFWVRKKLNVKDKQEALAIAESIARKISRTGQKGAFFVKEALIITRKQAKRIFEK